MTAAQERVLIRTLHVLLSIPILGYMYGPVASIPQASRFTRWVTMPLVVLTGFWLWLKPRILRRLRERRRQRTAVMIAVALAVVMLCMAGVAWLAAGAVTTGIPSALAVTELWNSKAREREQGGNQDRQSAQR